MRITAIQAKTERKRQDKSARCAEKRRGRTRILRVNGLIRPTPGAFATASTARRAKRLLNWQNAANLTSGGRPLGEFRIKGPVAPRVAADRTPLWECRVKQAMGKLRG